MWMLVCLLLFDVLATSKVISGWVPTCYSAQYSVWWLYSVAPLGNQATMTWYSTQSHYPDTAHEPTSPYTILIMLRAWLGSDKYQFESHRFDSIRVWTCEVLIPRSPKTGDGCFTHSATLSGLWMWMQSDIEKDAAFSSLFVTTAKIKCLYYIYTGCCGRVDRK